MKCSHLLRAVALKLFKSLEAKSDGWNDSLGWVSLETARQGGKPAMVIISNPGCPRCRKLKAKFVTHSGVKRLSPHFAMVRIHPQDLPEDEEIDVFRPDGRYVPRILFFDAGFNFLPDIKGTMVSYKYYYSEPDDIEMNMLRVLRMPKRS